jgi:hypothetical protein
MLLISDDLIERHSTGRLPTGGDKFLSRGTLRRPTLICPLHSSCDAAAIGAPSLPFFTPSGKVTIFAATEPRYDSSRCQRRKWLR